jgi:hypothetical protein
VLEPSLSNRLSVVSIDVASESALRNGEYVFFDCLTYDDLACLTKDERDAVLSCLGTQKRDLLLPLASLGPAVQRATGYLNRVHSKEDENFDGSLLHSDLAGFEFYWECRHLPDMIPALELGGHTELARDLAATDLSERGRPARLKAARKYTGNMEKFTWAFYQLFKRPAGPLKFSCDDISAPYTTRASCDDSGSFYMDPSPVKYLACLDDLVLNDRLVYKGSRKPTRKPTRRPRHGRPPDSCQPESNTSDQHDTSVTSSHVFVPSDLETTHVSYARVSSYFASPSAVQFLSLDSSQITAHNGKPQFVPDLSRNAEFRAALPTDEQQMTAAAQLPVKICNPLCSS